MEEHVTIRGLTRFAHRVPVLLKVAVLGLPAAFVSARVTYIEGTKDALGGLVVGLIVCLTLTPGLLIGTMLTPTRRSRWIFLVALVGVVSVGGCVGLCLLADEDLSITTLLAVPIVFGLAFMTPIGLLIAGLAFGSAWLGWWIGDRLVALTTPDFPACPSCEYNLTGLTTDRCPECGAPITRSTSGSTIGAKAVD